MQELEEEFQSGGEESRKKKQKKMMRMKEEMDEDGDVVVESSSEGLRDAAEVSLELTSENNDEKKREKKKNKRKKEKQRDVEADEGGGGTTEREVDEGAQLAVANDENEEERKKKKRRKDGASTGNEDGVLSATDVGNQKVKAEKSEKVLKERSELQEAGEEKKKKDKIHKVGNILESFEAGVLKNVSGDQEGRLGSGVEDKLEEHCVQLGDVKRSKETKVKRKKRERNSEETESLSEQDTIKPQKLVTEDERIAVGGSSHGSHDGKRRKNNLEEDNTLSLGKPTKKKKRTKDKLTGHAAPIWSSVLNRGLGSGDKLTMTAEETAGDDKCRMQSSSMSGDEKKTRKKKKIKCGKAEDKNVSKEGISNTEIASKNKKMKNARKRPKVSADEGTSSVGNLDVSHASTTAETKKKVKKVNFSGHVEVFPSTGDAKSNDQSNEDDLVQGKRFSQEEDEMIKQAVFDYIENNHLGEDGLDMVLQCKSHRQLKDCWKEIGAALPWRRQKSIYWRAHTLFRRSESRKWEPEELDLVRRYYKEHGPKWKEMAELLGKHRVHVKDTWRRIKLTNPNKGNWSQEEYQALFDLVNMDLQLKAFEEKKTKHGMLRENISWGAISKKLSTRRETACCMKWYMQLTSPMVTQGLWADTDDYCLIDALLELDASCIEDVEWGSLLENRSGDLCLKRWKQMTRHIGGHQEKSFMEQVELLATRYCPHMLQFRTLNEQKCGGDDVDES